MTGIRRLTGGIFAMTLSEPENNKMPLSRFFPPVEIRRFILGYAC
jgi:hypothetical protein